MCRGSCVIVNDKARFVLLQDEPARDKLTMKEFLNVLVVYEDHQTWRGHVVDEEVDQHSFQIILFIVKSRPVLVFKFW